jgi:hypothetical protein
MFTKFADVEAPWFAAAPAAPWLWLCVAAGGDAGAGWFWLGDWAQAAVAISAPAAVVIISFFNMVASV